MRSEIENYLRQEAKTDGYLSVHMDRFVESYLEIKPLLKPGIKIIDIGSYGHLTKVIKHFHEGIEIDTTDFDLREPFPIESAKYDLALCMEVIEHIKDREPKNIDEAAKHTGNGAYSMLCEINRILKHEGKLFLTTPNINSWLSIIRMMEHNDPKCFAPHPKEYSVNELFNMVCACGFNIDNFRTLDLWPNGNKAHALKVKRLRNYMVSEFFNEHHRGDNIFIMANSVFKPQSVLENTEWVKITLKDLFPCK
jgi:SAM-dependent methyltransferase